MGGNTNIDNELSKSHRSASVKTVLLVDDSDDLRVTTKWFLTHFGYAVDSVRSAEEGLVLFNPDIHDIVVTDSSMAGMSGSEMAHVIKMRSRNTPILMFTGSIPEDQSCVDLVIQKPAHLLALKDSMERLLAGENPASLASNDSRGLTESK